MTILFCILLMAAADSIPPATPPRANIEPAIEESGLRQLLTIRRVYVDRLTGGETAAQMRDMLMSRLGNTNLFLITENQERADALLRGAAEDLTFTDLHSTSDSTNARTHQGTSRSEHSA